MEQEGRSVICVCRISRPRGYKIKRNDWLLADKQPIIALYSESENELKFYNLEASY